MSITRTVTFGRKLERSVTVEVDAPSNVAGWVDKLGEPLVNRFLTERAASEIDNEAKRLMARDPDLTEAEAQDHFDNLFQFGKDMTVVEKAARLRAELAKLGEK
jgi:hypothetical protein